MTISKNVYLYTGNWQPNSGTAKLDGLDVQYLDYSLEEESYELLPSGD